MMSQIRILQIMYQKELIESYLDAYLQLQFDCTIISIGRILCLTGKRCIMMFFFRNQF